MAGEVYALADDCRLLKRYEDARQLWGCVVDNCPDSNDVIVMKSRIGIITVDVNLGDNPNVLADVNELIADYKGQPGLCQAVFQVGEEYYNRAFQMKNEGLETESEDCLQKGVAVWEKIRSIESRTIYPAHAYYFSAVCYRRLGEYENAIEYFQVVVDNWPGYQYAWSAQCLIGECYEKLQKSGALPEAEAEPLIEQAYKLVIENYRDSSLAGHACLKLAEMNLKKGRTLEAAGYYELFLTAAPGDPRIKSVKARLEELGGYNK